VNSYAIVTGMPSMVFTYISKGMRALSLCDDDGHATALCATFGIPIFAMHQQEECAQQAISRVRHALEMNSSNRNMATGDYRREACLMSTSWSALGNNMPASGHFQKQMKTYHVVRVTNIIPLQCFVLIFF
jgi:hypothetical protein